jgi:arylsulfatase
MNKPNVLLFMVDQMRSDMIAALGNTDIKTPNLDRLAGRATAFSNAFSPSPVCVPARCCLHYGRYPSSTGCYENDFPMPAEGQSFMDVMSDGGYRTHAVGKCHFTPDLLALRGFQTRLVQEEIIDDPKDDDYLNWLFAKPGTRHIIDPHGVRGDMYYIPQLSQQSQQLHPTNWVAQKSLDFLREQASNPEQNWLLFCSFIHPHPPFAPPSPWHKLYRATDMPLPQINDNCEENYTYINRVQNRYKFRDRGFDINLIRRIKAHYYACISFIDSRIGLILDHLEETGQIDNTLIIFTSDHGEHLGDNRCFGKRSMHDQAAGIPLLVSMPASLKSGAVCDEPVSLIDIYPTITAAAGLDTPPDCQGENLADVAAGKSSREIVFSEFGYGGDSICMAVSKKWKYFYSVPDARAYLFDRTNDPAEAKNLADDPNFAHIRDQYREKLIQFLDAGGRDDIVEGMAFKPLPTKKISDNPDDGLIFQDMPWAKEFVDETFDDGAYAKVTLRQ